MPNGDPVTVIDAIHTGIKLNISQTRTLEIWRELGGEIRDTEFARLWKEELEAFERWRQERRQS